MNEYLLRPAEIKDIPFLANVVIAAEKGRSDKLSYSTLFNLSQNEVNEYLVNIFEEGIDGCELSLSSFIVAEFKGQPIAALSAWIENLDGTLPSKILKSNLILNTFNRESINFFKTCVHIVKDILIEREPMALQLEYLFIDEKHLGKGLDLAMIDRQTKNGLQKYPALLKIQGQLFKNSIFAIIVLRKQGFNIVKLLSTSNNEIFKYLPFNEKILMEKMLKS